MSILQLTIFVFFCINATVAGNFLIRFIFEKKPRSSLNLPIYFILASSSIWSFGMGLMSIQNTDRWAYIFRTIGILGTFVFMASVQVSLCIISNIPKFPRNIMNWISFTGIPIFFLYSLPGQTVFVRNTIGTTFYFKPGWITNIYSLYFLVVSFNIFVVTLYTVRNNPLKRDVVAGKRLIIVELCIFFGAIFDMILPSLGREALPGSAITHFWGVCIYWLAIHEMFKSQLTTTNMSSYVYSSLNTPVLIFSSKYKLEIINNAAAEFFNLDLDTFVSGDLEISSLFESDNSLFIFSDNGHTTKSICKANRANCEISISRIEDSYKDNIGFICLIKDLTEQDLAISRLEEAKLAADAANMSKSLFLANMSHEIRTPMNAILGFSDIGLMEDVEDVSKVYFKEIKQAGNILLTIINEILNISKIELGKTEVENANYSSSRIIKDVELITRSNAGKKNLVFDVDIDPSFPESLYGDANKIREILLNLLGNAVKYTNTGSVKLQAMALAKDNDMSVIRFMVSDSGIGIKEEDIPTIFDKFTRVDSKLNSSTEGTGLGLSITKGLIDLLGGSIDVKSEYGKGTTFIVDIPQKVVASAPEQDASELQQQNTERSKNVLIENMHFLVVDDTKINLTVASKLLRKLGATVDTCLSGAESIEKCTANKYDLVFMDHMMPEMDGVEAMKKIRLIPGYEKGSAQKIIALTANAVDSAKEMLLLEGFDEFISKPMKFETLEETIQNLYSAK